VNAVSQQKSLVFVTGNDEKIRDANYILNDYAIEVEAIALSIHEIQSRDHNAIIEAKVKAAFRSIKRPLIVSDASWSIPALGGFPGPYMKDIAQWFSVENWLDVMRSQHDRSAILSETIAYYDGLVSAMFSSDRSGEFSHRPAGNRRTAFDKLIMMEGDQMTVAQVFDLTDRSSIAKERLSHYIQFAEWYNSQTQGT
jgi:XTP/dITP diphosphohydrolase